MPGSSPGHQSWQDLQHQKRALRRWISTWMSAFSYDFQIDEWWQLTDSNKVWAEWPKMNEKPKIMVASGTRDASVLLLLNIRRQTKTMPTSATQRRTASSFATTELTSCKNLSSTYFGTSKTVIWPSSWKSEPSAPGRFFARLPASLSCWCHRCHPYQKVRRQHAYKYELMSGSISMKVKITYWFGRRAKIRIEVWKGCSE